MWIAHFAPSLVLSRFAPATPLWALAFAGALPDFLHFGLTLVGLESSHASHGSSTLEYMGIEFKGSSTNCFPYSATYPYTHSTAGQLIVATVFAALITLSYRLSLVSFATLVLATLSHLPLDMAINRDESNINSAQYRRPIWKRHDVPLFDYPWGTFISDLGIFLFAVLFHARTVYPPEQHGSNMGIPVIPVEERKDMTFGYMMLLVAAVGTQAHFSFFGGEVEQDNIVKGGLFMAELVGFAYVLHLLQWYTTVDLRKPEEEEKKNN
ncbi:hypothetical protein H072_11584 [Dactylellina haptotyla CBS 200.50]|uniref:Uncharacterized protein n=1 Tax=Dactylellina haptotyla (strain CBS 200.50) TaxID=1284197 RepID=S7ZWF2_DACHA|nr:hypothetical protein H072_11584 [Dactylellina haptotyla CBS 200.50]